jgi:uncharacterized lipoprotein YddW (UPF0748 family)
VLPVLDFAAWKRARDKREGKIAEDAQVEMAMRFRMQRIRESVAKISGMLKEMKELTK